MIIGLTGRVGVGKSFAATCICDAFKFKCIDLDKIGHEILHDNSVKDTLIVQFGNEICANNTDINRQKLADIVFSDIKHLTFLNQLVHPKIKEAVNEILSKSKQNYVIVGALLKEIKLLEYCDHIIVIDAKEDKIKQKIGKKYKRSAYQMTSKDYKSMANSVIVNNYNKNFIEDLLNIVQNLMHA